MACTSALLTPAAKLSVRVPLLLAVTVPLTAPPRVRSAPAVSAPSVPLLLKWSSVLAPPLRDRFSVAPPQLPLPLVRAARSTSPRAAAVASTTAEASSV